MKNTSFPLFKTKSGARAPKFMLEDPVARKKYFQHKAGREIEKIRAYVEKGNTFMAFLLGKKNSGKGTYSKLFMEAVGEKWFAHISVGDIVRSVHKELQTSKTKKELLEFLRSRYRGFITPEKALEIITGRDTTTLLPTEVILALTERQISRFGRKAIFIDGFPRSLDQISYSLYFRALMGYRDDPDFFVFISVPESVIDERMKYRAICPICQTPRNLKLLRTKEVGYDAVMKRFFLLCDNPRCKGFGKSRMVSKEGDELGIEAIRDRIEADEKVSTMLMGLEGVPKVYLRNAVPVKEAKKFVDDYEVTPSYRYEWDKKENKVRVIEEPWIIKDEKGVLSYSLLPAAVCVSLIKQTARVLGL